ncbi:hypothetical protein [Spirosoma validum]|uniref:Uncharacterized protein n=1 Tax=Spirosoma validum TaxID=2771355 RepID=A0A927B6M5_9BACT|nr:hypothetical protein [Spirosoma validum]MBD2756243.1 hypothetical protein [Spirosoma validum]
MEKQFALKPATALKKVKALAAKHELSTKLNFSILLMCCDNGPIVDRDPQATAVFSL